MTLTAILPTLRQTLPDPLAAGVWPVDTTPTRDDVLVGGVSLCHETDRIGLPLVHGDGIRAVVVGRVASRVDRVGAVELEVAMPEGLRYVWTEARLIGRISAARAGHVRIGTGRSDRARCALPDDVAVGDVVAVPILRA